MLTSLGSVRAQTKGLLPTATAFDTVNIPNVKSTALQYSGQNPD